MRFFLAVIFSLLLASCAHHHKKPEHHHHAFKKQCAQSVALGDFKTMGHEDFKLEHGGKVYFFSSEVKMKKFKKHLDENIQNAERNWSRRDRSSMY